MRDSLLLPVVFLGFLIACFVLLALGYLMFLWDTHYLPSSLPSLSWAVSAAPGAARAVFVPATLAALFLVIIRMVRKPGVPVLSFLLSFFAASAALYFGIAGAHRLLGAPTAITLRSYLPLSPGHFNEVTQEVIYPTAVHGDSLGPTLLVKPGAKQAFTFEPRGTFRPATWSVEFPEGSRHLAVRPPNPNFSGELAPRSFLVSFIADVGRLRAFLDQAYATSRVEFLIALGGVVLFSVGCVGFAWVSRWPLMNVVLVAICFRLLFWLFSLLSTPIAGDAFALVVPKAYRAVAPSLGLAALAVLLLAWTIAFIRPPVRD